jgi:PAT family beta-lactamase induction signal transducer AmpG
VSGTAGPPAGSRADDAAPARRGAPVGDRAPWWHGWVAAASAYRNPRVLAMLFLGFSAGLPFMLVFSTLSAWLREAGIERATIGMLSWVGIIYSIKFFWAPVVDRLPLPLLGAALGRRRSWMLVAQAGIAVGLFNMAHADPVGHLGRVALIALAVAFCSATQDISVDAWRIESAPPREQGAMAAAYQLGYRIALMVASAGALWIAADHGWTVAYTTMAALVGVGLATTLLVTEPAAALTRRSLDQEARVIAWLERKAHWPAAFRQASGWFVGAVVCPFTDFFERNGARVAVLTLAFVATYRLAEFAMGSMTNPFYLDMGFSLKEIAAIAKGFGVFMSILGALVGGVAVARLGLGRTLVLGSALIIAANLMFAAFAWAGRPSVAGLAAVISADNVAMGIAGTALVAYLSSLTSASYTATQYALFSSVYALPGKLLMGTSGFVVDAIGYPRFFVYTAALALPALGLLYFLARAAAGGVTARGAGAG